MKGLQVLLAVILTGLQSSSQFALAEPNAQMVFTNDNSCFPSLAFPTPLPKNPGRPPSAWWCNQDTERGFLGFTYDSEACQSAGTLSADFTRMRHDFKARYVRLYGWCDDGGSYLNNVIQSAYTAGLGVYVTIWFGFDGGDAWKRRRDLVVNIIKTNPLAPYVVRSVDVGSEPLFDWVLPPQALADQIKYVKGLIGSYGVQVTISEMQYGYSVQGNSQMVLDAEDVVHAHELAFFDEDAKSGGDAKPSLLSSTNWFVSHTNRTRKIIFSQTGWPTNANVWPPNSPTAVASVDSAKAFAQLLDTSCETFKGITPHGGVGWFWHIWSDAMLDGWGLLDWNGKPKWAFAPRTDC